MDDIFDDGDGREWRMVPSEDRTAWVVQYRFQTEGGYSRSDWQDQAYIPQEIAKWLGNRMLWS